MPQSRTLKQNLDDAMLPLRVADFSGGLNSEADPQDMELNQSPDCLNVKILKPGRCIGRDGYVARVTGLPAVADGVAFFYDSFGNRKLAVWAGGNIYDCTNNIANLVTAGVYTAGQRICWTTLNNILYYSDGYTISGVGPTAFGMRYWDPTTATEGGVISSATAATVPTPACKALTTYGGQIVLANIKYTNGTTGNDTVLPSNVNDPTTILGTGAIKVGQGYGGEINVVMPFGVSSVGVTPYRALFVGKSKFGVYHLKGALSAAEEVLISCPSGVLDGQTARFVQMPEVGAAVVFLGTDSKVWWTNGVTSGELSSQIRSELALYVSDRLAVSAASRFAAVMNYQDFQYVLDLGAGRHYCYDYDRRAWTKYQGWPSGVWAETKDANGQPSIYVGDDSATQICQANIGITDGGTAIDQYWKTPFMNAGDPDVLKIWKFIFAAWATDLASLTVTGTVNLGSGQVATVSLVPTDTSSDARWDVATWDSDMWVGGGGVTYPLFKQRKRLMVPTTGLDGSYDSLRGYDLQIKISNASSAAGGHFELLGFTVTYLPRGRKRVA